MTNPSGGGLRPLAGITVIDIGQYLAGPYGPMLLADLGADVIKVEPISGDAMRPVTKPFVGCQRGKRSVAVDLKTAEGREVVLRLAERADVVHHNMTLGVADRLGIGYEALRARNPALVHCNTWAYGAEGPMAAFGGLDPLYQAASGLEYEAGAVQEGNPPLYLRFGMCDTGNALLSVIGVLCAVLHQRRTGEGQDLWTSLFNAGAVYSSATFIDGSGVAVEGPRLDKAQTGLAPGYRLYETQAGWIQIAAVTDEHWRALCAVLGVGELGDDPRAADADRRTAHRAELEAELAPAFRKRTARAWWLLLEEAGVPAEVSIDTNEGEVVLHDDHNVELGLVSEYEHARLGRMRQFGDLVRFSGCEPAEHTPPPMVGQHTREVLGWVGYDDQSIDELIAQGVAYEPDDNYRWSA